ncbi:MAG: hypothetical protein JWM59_4384 [Verrucomicrobiales bacterium]|nr:hypothetical protein [Verrucomicrobiales bacterium]
MVAANMAGAAVFRVVSAADSGPGSLREMLSSAALAPGPDEVVFADSLQAITLLSQISITDSGGVSVEGDGVALGMSAVGGRHFSVAEGSSLSLKGLTLHSGKVSGPEVEVNAGGSILNRGHLNLENCMFSANLAFNGGGAIVNDGNLDASHCGFRDNSAVGGQGGAISNRGAANFRNCAFWDNKSAYHGGAVFNDEDSRLTLTNCTLSNNTAVRGGALAQLEGGKMTVTHCTINANTANDFGGGVFLEECELTLTNSIISGNTGPEGRGADVCSFDGVMTRVGANLIRFQYSTGQESGPAAITADARLRWGTYPEVTMITMVPLSGSPAVDGVPADAIVAGLSSDQRGAPRNQDGDGNAVAMPDIGALEVSVTSVTTREDEFDTPSGARVSLREALRDAVAGRSIVFDPAVFSGTAADGTITLDPARGEMVAARDTLVDGTAIVGGITLDGGPGTNRILFINRNRSVILAGLKLTGGDGTGASMAGRFSNNSGGAVCNDGHLTLIRCTLSGNKAGFLGGAVLSGESLRLEDCVFSGNTAATGGAIYNYGDFAASGCTLTGNSARHGGAIASNYRMALSRCSFSGNSAKATAGPGDTGAAGALDCYEGDYVYLNSCTFHGNSTDGDGGAVRFAESGGAYVTNCTLTDNFSGRSGGAICSTDKTRTEVTHCTVSANSAGVSGGGIFCRDLSGTLTLVNSIVAGNAAPDGQGSDICNEEHVMRLGANIVQSLVNQAAAGGSRGVDTGQPALAMDPLLAPLGDYGGPTLTMALKPGSRAVNAAIPLPDITPTNADQRGFPYIYTADIGAYESGAAANFRAWAVENSGSALLFDADEDRDGASNGLEYALRGNPVLPEATPLFTAPAPGWGQDDELVYYTLSFNYQEGARNLRYLLQRTSAPGQANAWTTILTLTPPNAAVTPEGIRYYDFNQGSGHFHDINAGAFTTFWRLKVELITP